MKELVGFSRDVNGEILGGSAIFRDEVSFTSWAEIQSPLTFAKGVAGDDAAVGAGTNVGFVTGEGVAGDHAVQGVDGESGFGLVFEHVVEALEPAGLIDLEGGTIFLKKASGDTGGLIERGDIGGPAVVDACFGAAENVELIQVDSGAFGDLDTSDGFATSIEGCGAGTSGGDGDKLGFFD